MAQESPQRAYRLLGPLEVEVGGRAVQLHGKQRTLLALLLLRAGDVVSSDELIEALWRGGAPGKAANTLQVHVSRLRRLLEPGRTARAPTSVLATRGPGYALAVERDELDLERFERLLAEGRDELAAGDAAAAAAALRSALALWRGSPLADLALEPFAQAEIRRLEELRLEALEQRVEADLALGRHAELVAELEGLVAEHPLRERLRGQLMLALYRTGRQADALAAYREARAALDEELGLEPGPALRRLEQAILRHDPDLDPASPAEPAPAPREERKLVTVVSAGLAQAAGVDPEVLRRRSERALATAAALFERHGARVERAPGLPLLAIFGAAATRESDALEATRAALAARDELAAGGIRLRAGIATGEAFVAGGAVLAGDVLESAIRAEQAAAGGDVLVDGSAWQALAGAAVLEPAGPGRWRLAGLRAAAEPISRSLDTPLVGRTHELAQLLQAFERAGRERGCHLCTVLGTPGIGKSRLAHELAKAVSGRATVLTARCQGTGEGGPLGPLRDLVEVAVGPDIAAGVAAALGDDPDAALVAERLAAAVGLTTAQADRDDTAWALRRLVAALGRARPVVISLDDIHWADPSLLELVDHLVEWLRDVPVLVLCLARPELREAHPGWGASAFSSSTLLLEPLSPDESDELVAALAEPTRLAPAVRARVAATAEGNPLFIEQLLAFVGEEDGGAPLVIPPTIRGLLNARLDALPPAERRVLELASVVGRDFTTAAVAALAAAVAALAAPDERDGLGQVLHALVRRQLVAPGSEDGTGPGYRFRHQLIRDAAYESLPKRLRAELHERVADAAEDLHATERDLVAGHHLEQACAYRAELDPDDPALPDLARRCVERLGAAAGAELFRGNARAAAPLLERALALTGTDGSRRAALLLDLAEVRRDLGELTGAHAALDEAIALGPAPVAAHARILSLRIEVQSDSRLSLDHVRREVKSAIAELEQVGDRRGLAQGWYLLAWTSLIRCHATETERALRRSVHYAREAGSGLAVRHGTHLMLGAGLFGPLPVPKAIRRCEDVLAQGPEQRIAAAAYRALGGLRAMTGEFAEARTMLERDHELSEELGLRLGIAGAAGIWYLLGLLSGDLAVAVERLRQGLALSEDAGDTTAASTLAALLADVLERQGDLAEAERLVAKSAGDSLRDDFYSRITCGSAHARLLARRGAADAEEVARAAVALAARTDYLSTHADALLSLAAVLAAAGRGSEAREAVHEACVLYERKGNVAALALARELDAGYAGTSNPSRDRQSRTCASSSSVGGTSGNR